MVAKIGVSHIYDLLILALSYLNILPSFFSLALGIGKWVREKKKKVWRKAEKDGDWEW